MTAVVSSPSLADALARPVHAAFQNGWRQWGMSQGSAHALPTAIGPFASVQRGDPHAGSDLRTLIADRNASVLLLEEGDVFVPPSLARFETQCALQMVLSSNEIHGGADHIMPLNRHDAQDMLDLARTTEPGPFEIGTHLLGPFIGFRDKDQLIAMVGQRMQLNGFVEISALCVRPDCQGRGLGTQLIGAMVQRILQSGCTPFLHTYKSNQGAIALYRRLGFDVRAEMQIARVGLKR